MNTKFLETLVVLSRVGSFRETAQVMITTQAAISQRIAALEEELGCDLVDRSARRLQLTPRGELVVRQAERMLALERELRESTRPDAPAAGRVRIGAIETVVHTWLSPLIRRLAERCPQVEPDLSVDTARNLQEQFRQRKLDLMIQNDPFPEAIASLDYRVTPLCEFPLRWVARPELLPASGRLSLQDLERVPLLTFSRTSSPQAHVRALFAEQQGSPVRICSFPSVQSIIQLACTGYGIAAIPPVFVREQMARGELWQCEGPALPAMMITAMAESRMSVAVRETLGVVREVVSEFCEQAGPDWARPLEAEQV